METIFIVIMTNSEEQIEVLDYKEFFNIFLKIPYRDCRSSWGVAVPVTSASSGEQGRAGPTSLLAPVWEETLCLVSKEASKRRHPHPARTSAHPCTLTFAHLCLQNIQLQCGSIDYLPICLYGLARSFPSSGSEITWMCITCILH